MSKPLFVIDYGSSRAQDTAIIHAKMFCQEQKLTPKMVKIQDRCGRIMVVKR